jgi:hypothetical protein
MHKETFPEAMKVLDQHRLAFDLLFKEYGERFEDQSRLRQMAMRGLALGVVRRAGRLFEHGDRATCDCLMEAALPLYPEIRREREWKSLRWKRRIGRHATRAVRRFLSALRKPTRVGRSPFGRCEVFEAA